MIKFLFSFLLTIASTVPWENTEINSVNRCEMVTSFNVGAPRVDLSGEWDFSFCGGEWRKMPVPGMWELNGCGDPLYLSHGYAWRTNAENTPGKAPDWHNYYGTYKKTVTVPSQWKGKDIFINIGSVTSCILLSINGKEVGYSEDSKLAATFDITKFVVPGKPAEIQMDVRRWCDGTYVEDQDFWRFTGLARETFLFARPKARISDIRINAAADGSYTINATSTKGIASLKYYIDGVEVAPVGKYPSPRLWSAEQPNLYELRVEALTSKGKVAERAHLRFGFRTVEISGKQLLVNGKPILVKGVNRHEMSPEGGYVVTLEQMVEDIRIMKSLNVNAVRCSHYPDDPRWLDLCDEYGLYVVDEANLESHGMGYEEGTLARNPLYAKTHMERMTRMFQRDYNHPSIIVWSLGNEAGDGPNFEACYNFLKKADPSRPVQYERAIDSYNGTKWPGYESDIFCPMYLNYDKSEKYAKNGRHPFIQCEYAHAMGNSMGGFKEYWDLIRKYPGFQGGFIWDFVDQAIKWPSQKSTTGFIYAFGGDFNETDGSGNSFNCNGIIASDRSFHPHAYEVRYQYQNIWTSPLDVNTGKIKVYNENFFTSLEGYRMQWELVSNGTAVLSGVFDALDAAPGETQTVDLNYDASDYPGELFLNVRYYTKTCSGLIPAAAQVAYDQILVRKENIRRPGFEHHVNWSVGFNEKTGALNSFKVDSHELVTEELMPCFGRALTENDLGAKLKEKMTCWLYPDIKLESFSKSDNKVVAEYSVGCFANVIMEYSIDRDGVTVREKLSVAENVANIFRVGVEMAIDGRCDCLKFYGAGPWECYSDRQSAALVGVYSQKVSEQYNYSYARPQESGTHTRMRWMDVCSGFGRGITISAVDSDFSASALPFSRRDIDMSITGGTRYEHGDQRHSLELRPDGKTHLNIDLVQMGLGCVNSWATTAREEYLIPAKNYEFTFRIEPKY